MKRRLLGIHVIHLLGIHDIRAHGGVRVSWQDYQGPFHKWNGDEIPFIFGGTRCVY